MLSNTCKYGIRSVLYIALNQEEKGKIGIKKISEELKIPTPFLGKILQLLAKKKILKSTKGPHGGFTLSKKPEEIFLIEIIEAIDGLDFFNTCLIGLNSCTQNPDISPCPLHERYGKIRDQLFLLFKSENIAQLIDEIKTSGGTINL